MRLLQAVLLSLLAFSCSSSSPSNEQSAKNALGGVEYLSDSEAPLALGTGPLFLTDVMIDGSAWEIFMSSDSTCKNRDSGTLFQWLEPAYKPTEPQSHHGMKLFVAAGKALCFHSSVGQTKLVWAGSRAKP